MNKTANVQNIETNKGASDQTGINWQRVLRGLLIVLSFLAAVAFWGTFIYAIVIGNVKLAMFFGQIIAIMIGVAVAVAILQKLYRIITKS